MALIEYHRSILLDGRTFPSHIERRIARVRLNAMILRAGRVPSGRRRWRTMQYPFGVILILSQWAVSPGVVAFELPRPLGSGRPSEPLAQPT